MNLEVDDVDALLRAVFPAAPRFQTPKRAHTVSYRTARRRRHPLNASEWRALMGWIIPEPRPRELSFEQSDAAEARFRERQRHPKGVDQCIPRVGEDAMWSTAEPERPRRRTEVWSPDRFDRYEAEAYRRGGTRCGRMRDEDRKQGSQ